MRPPCFFSVLFLQYTSARLFQSKTEGEKKHPTPQKDKKQAKKNAWQLLPAGFTRRTKRKILGEDGCGADGGPDFCSPNWHSLLSHSSQPSFNIIPRLPVWFDALVRQQIRRATRRATPPLPPSCLYPVKSASVTPVTQKHLGWSLLK